MQERSNRSRSFTLRDINMLKVILCSGLFPQVGLADDCNSFKGDSEQAFHTKVGFSWLPWLLTCSFLIGNKLYSLSLIHI